MRSIKLNRAVVMIANHSNLKDRFFYLDCWNVRSIKLNRAIVMIANHSNLSLH